MAVPKVAHKWSKQWRSLHLCVLPVSGLQGPLFPMQAERGPGPAPWARAGALWGFRSPRCAKVCVWGARVREEQGTRAWQAHWDQILTQCVSPQIHTLRHNPQGECVRKWGLWEGLHEEGGGP